MSGYADEAAAGFERSRAVFGAVVAELADPECAQVTHAELEERLTERSRELMRRLFQDHVDVRAVREERRTGVVGPDEVLAVAETGRERSLTKVCRPTCAVIRSSSPAAVAVNTSEAHRARPATPGGSLGVAGEDHRLISCANAGSGPIAHMPRHSRLCSHARDGAIGAVATSRDSCRREDRFGQPRLAGDRCPDRGKDIEVLVYAGG
jgi:hypothetical protein